MTVVRASAPVRLDFAGGWTDVAPFTEEGGVVVNAAIALRTTVTLMPSTEGYHLAADDLAVEHRCDRGGLAAEGPLPLHRAMLRAAGTPPCTLRSRAAAPPGGGLGGSGALGVALAAATARAGGRVPDRGALAEDAFRVESIGAAVAGGRQDQYAAAFGGFHRFTFRGDAVGIEPLTLEPGFLTRLARHTILCYTGESRFSSGTITRVMEAYRRREPVVTEALRALTGIADAMADALRAGDLGRTADALAANWEAQQRLDPGMCTPGMAALHARMRNAGALAGKAAGSGAGGSMFFVVDDPERAHAAALAAGVTVLPVTWDTVGVSWT